MGLTVRVQPVIVARDWRATLDWLSRVFELPITAAHESSQFGQILTSAERVGVVGRSVPVGEGGCVLEVEVFDLEAALERAQVNKAKLISGPEEVTSGGGRQARIQIPTGVTLWLWEADEEAEPHAALGDGDLHFSVRRRINAPAEKVFEAITRADQLTRYFVKDAKGDLKSGADVTWIWEGDAVALEVTRVVPNETVEFVWEAYGVDYLTRVRFDVVPHSNMHTRLTVVESGWHNDARGRQSAFDHAEGWTEFLLHARLWIEKGIDIR